MTLWPRRSNRRWLFTSGSFVQFGRDVGAPSSIDFADYLRGRWYAPFLKELDSIDMKMTNAGLLNRDVFLDAPASPDGKRFPKDISDALAQYVTVSEEYNLHALAFNQKTIAIVKGNDVLGPLITSYRGNKGGPVLHPGELSDETRLGNALSSIQTNPDVELSFEIDLPRAVSQVAAKIPTISFGSDLPRLQSILSSIRSAVIKSDEYKQFTTARDKLVKTAAQLRVAVNAAGGKP